MAAKPPHCLRMPAGAPLTACSARWTHGPVAGAASLTYEFEHWNLPFLSLTACSTLCDTGTGVDALFPCRRVRQLVATPVLSPCAGDHDRSGTPVEAKPWKARNSGRQDASRRPEESDQLLKCVRIFSNAEFALSTGSQAARPPPS